MSKLVALVLVLSVALARPSPVSAQAKDDFLRALVDFTNAASGIHGDEGPALLAALEAMDAGLAQWDAAVAKVEAGFASQIGGAAPSIAVRMRAALASVYLDRGRINDAIAQLEAAAALDATNADVHLLRGIAYDAARRPAEAAAAYRIAWQRAPDNPVVGYLFLRSADPDSPAADYAAALRTLSSTVAAATATASSPPFAVFRLLDEGSLRAPVFVGAAYASALVLLESGKYREAIVRLREIASTDPLISDPALRSEPAVRASAASRRGDVAAATTEAAMVTTQHPGSSEAHRLLGAALSAAKKYPEAVQHFATAIRLNPQDERSWLALADVRVSTGDLVGARAVLGEALRASPTSAAAHWILGQLQERLGDQAGALKSFETAASMPLLGGAHHARRATGRLLHSRLDLDGAATAYTQRVAIVPNDADAHFDLGEVLRAQEKLGAALAEYLAAALLNPASARPLAMVGLVHASSGRDAEAVRFLRRAVTIDASHLEARYALSRALLRLGQADDARRELAIFQQLQSKAMEDERRRYRENQQKIDALLGQPRTETPR